MVWNLAEDGWAEADALATVEDMATSGELDVARLPIALNRRIDP